MPDPLMEALEDRLALLAGEWRLTHNENVIPQYHAVYNCMVALGWDQSLDMESHLPTRLMPDHYHEIMERIRSNK